MAGAAHPCIEPGQVQLAAGASRHCLHAKTGEEESDDGKDTAHAADGTFILGNLRPDPHQWRLKDRTVQIAARSKYMWL